MVYVSFVYSARIQCQCSPGAEPGCVRYNTFFHPPKNNEGESNSTLITWFTYESLYRWMRLIKRIFLVTGLVILKLTQPLIPAKKTDSSNFYGTEGVSILALGIFGGKIHLALAGRWLESYTWNITVWIFHWKITYQKKKFNTCWNGEIKRSILLFFVVVGPV